MTIMLHFKKKFTMPDADLERLEMAMRIVAELLEDAVCRKSVNQRLFKQGIYNINSAKDLKTFTFHVIREIESHARRD